MSASPIPTDPAQLADPAHPANPLQPYWAKRDFSITSEPYGEHAPAGEQLSFVIQKHAARSLHFDFRLELDGVLVSWAVPKGPSLDPAVKRMAIHVEDHPLSYASFEGMIPPKQYGAGSVIAWDHGTWEPVGDARAGLANGKLAFRLHGQKLAGLWELVRIKKPATGSTGNRQDAWLLFKKRDEFARLELDYDVVTALPDSVITKPLTAPPRGAVAGPTADADAQANADTRRGVPKSAAAMLTGAVKATLPATLAPQLATFASAAPTEGTWVSEVKFDGYRLLARIDHGRVTLFTRGGHDWSAKLPQLVADLSALRVGSAWIDGEIVVLDGAGRPDFGALQKAFDTEVKASAHAGRDAIRYFVFDLPYLDGLDLRETPLIERRRVLESLLDRSGFGTSSSRLRFSVAFDAEPAALLASACRMQLEGVIVKRADAPYACGRSVTWLKLKCKQRQEFVVCGYTDRSDGTAQIGSLLLGVHAPDGALVSVGSVGTGFSAQQAQALRQALTALRIPAPPFAAVAQGVARPGRWSKRAVGSEHWVTPTLVAEVAFAEWTVDGQIRHATYVALRADKPARSVTRELAVAPPALAAPVSSTTRKARVPKTLGAPIQITHGERVIDAASGLTKLDLVGYYEAIATRILPHLKGRPCSLVRGPDGVGGTLFFQKHGEKIGIPGITELDPALSPQHAALLEVGSARALNGAAQMNVIEFHTWNSLVRNINRPDRMVFDLDPGEGTPWQDVQEAATLVRGLLAELGLAAWLKTSGGKGLHLVVPLKPTRSFDTVKAFSRAVVQHLAQVIPARFVAKSGPANRLGKVFVDYLRNGHGATTAAAFTARARPGLGVSMPIHWDALASLTSGAHCTVATAREHLAQQTDDPWDSYWSAGQTLTTAMQRLGFKPETQALKEIYTQP